MLSADVIDDESARASDDMSIDPDIPAVQDPGRAPGLHDDIDARIVKNSLWVGLSYGGGQILAMVSMLVLLRLLTPSDFGVVAIGMTLLGVLAYVQESGLGSALVHFREDPRHTAASALIFSAVSSGSLALGVALLAPVYTHLVHSPQSTGIVRALSVVLLLRGLAIIPGAILERALLFKTRAKSELSGYIMLATVSISCAAFGLGPWSLVLGQIAATGTQLTAVWLLVPWRPRLRDASRATLVGMLRYGRFVSASNLLNLIGLSLDNLTVSRQLGSGPLGVYALSYRLAEIPNTVISIVVGRVMFSVYSSLHGNLAALRHAYLENLRRTMLFALPVTLGIGIAADPIVPALLGDQWLTAETPLRILALFGLVRLIAGPSGELFKGVGRPHLGVAAPATFFVVALSSLVILVPRHGIDGAAAAMFIAVAVAAFVSTGFLLRVLQLSFFDLLRAISLPALVAAPFALALLAVLPFALKLDPWPGLALLVVTGTIAYTASVALLGRALVRPIWAALRHRGAES